MRGRGERGRSGLVLVVVLGLLVVGCGREPVRTPVGDLAAAAGAGSSSSAGGRLDRGDFGDLTGVCGPAPDGLDRAATDVGVTADTIQVGVLADPGAAPRPGLNREIFDASIAFTEWCNRLGGINGRRIELRLRDGKLFETQQRIIEACNEGDFFLVGGGNVLDSATQPDRLACELPQIASFGTTPEASASDLSLLPGQIPGELLNIGDLAYLAERYPGSTDAMAYIIPAIATADVLATRFTGLIEAIGGTQVYAYQYNPTGESSWRPIAEQLRAAGVRGLLWAGEPSMLASLVKALDTIGYQPDFIKAETNTYDAAFLDEVAPLGDNIYVYTLFPPFLGDGPFVPAIEDYLTLLDRYGPADAKRATFGVIAVSSWLLFAQAVTACGSEVTRDCVFDRARSQTSWTGGGLQVPVNLAERTLEPCINSLKVDGGAFVQTELVPPGEPFACDPAWLVPLPGEVPAGIRCPSGVDRPLPSECVG